MISKIKSLLRVTAVRLSLAYTIAFAVLAIIVVLYMTGGAVNFLRQQYQASIEAEIAVFKQVYQTEGLNGLVNEMEIRASGPGAKLYVIADQTGRIMAGNIRDLNSDILSREGWALRPFKYEGYQSFTSRSEDDDDEFEQPHAVAKVFRLQNGLRVLVGQDIGQPERFRSIVARSLWLAMSVMMLASLIIWFFVGRSALKRIDMVSKSTDRILGGDRTERLPITGSRDEFDRLSTRMNSMLDRIGLLDDGLKNVSDSIAHDLKTPLTRLRNKVDAALAGEPDLKTSKEVLAQVITDSDQLIKTFNALLMISRVESGSQVAELVELDMTTIMDDICELYEPVAEEEYKRIICNFEKGIKLRGNRELLSQAITNLVDNALKYGMPTDKRKKPEITLKLEKKGREIIVGVADNGAGVDEADWQKVKERFSRLDASRTKPGNGLGLSLVEAIVKLHDGELKFADAKPGFAVSMVFLLAN